MSQPGDDIFGRIIDWVHAQHEGCLTTEQQAQLEALVLSDPRAAALYVESVTQTASLRLWAAAEQTRTQSQSEMEGDWGAAMASSDAMVLPALRDLDDSGDSDERPRRLPTFSTPARPAARWRAPAVRWWWIAGGSLAASIAIVVPTLMLNGRSNVSTNTPTARPDPAPIATPAPPRQPSVPPVATMPARRHPTAVVSAVAAAVLKGSPAPLAGSELTVGQTLDLTAGAMEITFDSGAVVVLSAPARSQVAGPNLLAFERGSMTAHVPPAATGFRVDAPGLAAIDRGTDFGIRTDASGVAETVAGSELHVFTGVVDSGAARGPASSAPADETLLPVLAGHAVSHGVDDDAAPHRIDYAPAGFVHSIELYRMNLPIHASGAGIPFGFPDPAWQAVADPAGPFRRVRPAYAAAFNPDTHIALSTTSRWISTTPEPTNVAGGNYRFRTTVALPEFAPGTVSIGADIAADDWITDIVVNGVSTAGDNGGAIGQVARLHPVKWSLDHAPWRVGDNQIDLLVWNKPDKLNRSNYMGFNLFWTAQFGPVVHRAAPVGTNGSAVPP